MPEKGSLVAQGKTKEIYEALNMPGFVIVASKDDITKNDDPSATKVMVGKAVHSTATTSAVFSLLKLAGIPVAFERQISATEFLAPECKMVLLEVVMRRYAVGSYLKRHPHLAKKEGKAPHRFHQLVFELFLKTTGGHIINKDGLPAGKTPNYKGTEKPIDDPFILNPIEDVWQLMHPKLPKWDEDADLRSPVFRNQILPDGVTVDMIEEIARKVFLVLEGAWAQLGCRLIDFKIEFGIDNNGNLLVADVIDNDSWRLRTAGWGELSKQLFRDNATMSEISDKYELVANLVQRFSVPKQVVVLWRGSDSDAVPEVPAIHGVDVVPVVVSGHKSPNKAMEELESILAQYPQGGVIITIVGMSNGLGPTLATRTSWPVIAVPATAKDRPHDVWSSLEAPSQVPLATILSPKNAVLSALNMLAMKNPITYMHRQYEIEKLDK